MSPFPTEIQIENKSVISKFQVYGRVDQNIIAASYDAVHDVFRQKGYWGEKPELHISDGMLLLPSGISIPACYEVNRDTLIGMIRVSVAGIINGMRSVETGIPDYVIVSAYVAHEAMEHVNFKSGRQILFSNEPARNEKEQRRNSLSERSANQIASEVTLRRYGVDFVFGDDIDD